MSLNKTNLATIALKNLGRHKVKTLLTTIAVIVGVALFIFTDSLLYGMDIDSRRNLINYETGSAKIYSKAYFEKKDELPIYEAFDNYMPIIDELDKQGYNATPRAVLSGALMSLSQELPFLLIGIDPEQENKVFKYNEYIEEGKFVENGQFEGMIGVRGARDLDVKVGDKVRLSTTIDMKNEAGKIKHVHQLIDLSICGIINSPNPKVNGNVIYLPLDILQDEQGLLLEGKITEICIRQKGAKVHALASKSEMPEIITSKLGSILPKELILVSWKEDAKDFLAITQSKTVGNKIIVVILLLLSLIGVANTMLMSIFERTKEIGMLRALGMNNFQVFKLVLYEAAFIGMIGTGLGIIVGAFVSYLGIEYGLDYTEMMADINVEEMGYRLAGVFKGAWNIRVIIGTGIAGPIISALVSIPPALKAMKLSIVDCLRFE